MLRIFKNHWPIFVTLLLLLIIVLVVLNSSLKLNDGNFVYAIDDPYIHMAIAKNFTTNGNWGPTSYEFASASSSILWTWLIVFFYYIFGVNVITPFILALISAIALLIVAYLILYKLRLPKYLSFIVILLILLITPIPAMIFTGQEHLLHAVITIIVIYLASKFLSKEFEPVKEKKIKIYLLALAPFITMVRYEGLFLMGILFILFLFRKKIIFAFSFISLALLPLIISGWISVTNGGMYLPNSVLVKVASKNILTISGLINFLDYNPLIVYPFIYFIFISILILSLLKKKFLHWNLVGYYLLISLFLVLAHTELIRSDWFFRYTAYLIPIITISIFMIFNNFLLERKNNFLNKSNSINILLIICIIVVGFIPSLKIRGYEILKILPRATQSIYLQQYQMSRFVNQYYNNQPIALMDIGVVSYYNNILLLDYYGLANNDIAKLIVDNKYKLVDIESISKNRQIKLIIVHNNFIRNYYGKIPDSWITAGNWNNPNNFSSRENSVSLYTINIADNTQLINNLREFSNNLPEEIIQSGPYTL